MGHRRACPPAASREVHSVQIHHVKFFLAPGGRADRGRGRTGSFPSSQVATTNTRISAWEKEDHAPPPIDRHRRRREEEEARRYIAFPQWLFSPFLSALNCSLMPCRPPSLSPWSASNVFHIYVLRYFIARPADAWNAHTPRSGVVPLHGVHYVLFGRVRVRTPYAACNGSPANGDWGYADG